MVSSQSFGEVLYDLIEELLAPVADDYCWYAKSADPSLEERPGYGGRLLVKDGSQLRVLCEGVRVHEDELVA